MSFFEVLVYTLGFFIPSICSLVFRAVGLGYKSRGRVLAGFCVFTLYALMVPSVLISAMGYDQYTRIAPAVIALGGLSVLIFSTDTPGKTIFLHLLQGSMVEVVSTPLNMLRLLLGFSYEMQLLLLCILCPIVCAAALRFWAKPLRFMADNLQGNMFPILLMPAITLLIILVLPAYPAHNFEFHPVYCTVMMLMVELSFFLYIYNLYRNLLKVSTLAKQELQQELLQTELFTYEDFLQTARQNRHDLRHHNSILLEYLTEGDIERAKEYLMRQCEDLAEASMTSYCENVTANAVLRLYERKTRGLGISYSVRADIPTDLPLSDTELGGMLSNLLENACEACGRAGGIGAAILVHAERDEYNLKMEIRNSIAGEVGFDQHQMPISEKTGGGVGTRSVIAVVKRHGGMLKFSTQGNQFIVRILLPLEESPTEQEE